MEVAIDPGGCLVDPSFCVPVIVPPVVITASATYMDNLLITGRYG